MKFLVTGGTGTFGSAVVKYLLANTNDEIIVFSRDETKQYLLKNEISQNKRVQFVIGDVRDKNSMKKYFKDVDYVFHAAALKHIPACQENPLQAIMTNIIGTSNVFDLAIENNVKKVIYLSTDKAVNPTSVMGMTKSIAEQIVKNNNSNTEFVITRFCNLAISQGSVIPLWISQIKQGKNITLTSEQMNRYFISTNDAVDLVIKAFQLGKQGEIFIKKAKQYNLKTIAESLIKIYDSNVKIDITGIRSGEKLNEQLFSPDEFAEEYDDFYILKGDKKVILPNYVEDEATTITDVKNWLNDESKKLALV